MIEIFDFLTRPAVLITLLGLLLVQVYRSLSSQSEIPPELPWIGKDSRKAFAETRAHFSSLTRLQYWLAEGYEKVPWA